MSNEKNKGICLSCTFIEYCMNYKLSKKTIQFCEEYFCSKPATSSHPTSSDVQRTAAESRKISDKNTNDIKLIGLCSNCDNRESCSLQKSEGGVWHCEEYI